MDPRNSAIPAESGGIDRSDAMQTKLDASTNTYEEHSVTRATNFLIRTYEDDNRQRKDRGSFTGGIASELAAWYEKLRTAIENRDEEVILRAAIERILRRRLLLGGNGESVAGPLVRELIWARYFTDDSIAEEKITEIQTVIDLYLNLRRNVQTYNKISESDLNEWIYQLMSSHIESLLSPGRKTEAMISYIFHNIVEKVNIKDDTKETRDIQVFIAIRKAFAKEDLPFLRYALFTQYFGVLTDKNVRDIMRRFSQGQHVIDAQLEYPGRFKIFEFVKRQIPPFLILDDIMKNYDDKFRDFIKEDEEFTNVIVQTCDARYANISGKVRRAIVRSIIFILLSKVFLALTIEGTYDRITYGFIKWDVIAINIAIPVSMMIIVSLFLKAPGMDNTDRIVARIKSLLFDEKPQLGKDLVFNHKPRAQTFMDTIFTTVWLGTFVASFGIIIYVLSKLQFNYVSQGFFIFFFAIVSFLSYRINQAASLYTVKDKPSIVTPFVDFFFMPIARVGRVLAEGVRSVNIFVFLLDMLIEMPFKGLVAFFEKWFFFLHSKREDLA
ncbi:MAG TPA: hypothetical protein VG965_03900 [Patescibacteria group bacterium]|nr:hypothetical protein [Patescibacteria group bacterium]